LVPDTQHYPPIRVFIRASIHRLMDCDTVVRIASAFSDQLGIPLRAAEVELAADVEGDEMTARQLNREHYVPRVRRAVSIRAREGLNEDGRDRSAGTLIDYRGGRRSGRSARVYIKTEDGVRVLRLEWVFRGPQLRKLGIVGDRAGLL
jgi:hypothetical protein